MVPPSDHHQLGHGFDAGGHSREIRYHQPHRSDGKTCPTGLYITGLGINDNHRFERLKIASGGTAPSFVNGINVDGRMIWAQFRDVEVDGSTGNTCQFDSSVSGGIICFTTPFVICFATAVPGGGGFGQVEREQPTPHPPI